jgi:predicted nucleotidyltransferase
MSITKETINKAIELSKHYGVVKLILFGSALDNLSAAKDLDLACSGINDWSFFELSAKLEEELKIQVDLIPLDDSQFSKHISKIGKVLYEQV